MASVSELLPICTSEDVKKRIDAYHVLTEKLSSLPVGSSWGDEITKEIAKLLITNVEKDLFVSEEKINYEATGFLGCFLANEKLMDLLTEEEEQHIIESIIRLLEESKDKSVITRCLWSLAQSKFECEIYSKNLSKVLKLILNILRCEATAIIIYESLQVMKSLVESIPKEILEKAEDWFPSLFIYLFHDSSKIRGVAWQSLNFCHNYNQQNNQIYPLDACIVPFIPALQSEYCKQMTNHVDENCMVALKIWRLLVWWLGKRMHNGTALINPFLEVVERAFKSSKSEIRVEAFKCWHTLISNFSIDFKVLSHPKRVKLLAAPLKANNAKTEDVASIKLFTWWFLVCKLGEKIVDYFELVMVPLLKFCFNPNRLSQSGLNERMLLIPGASSPCSKYPNLLLKSCEVLACTLSTGQISTSHYSFSISNTNKTILNPLLFSRNNQLIMGCIADMLPYLDSLNQKHIDVMRIIIKSTLKHINSIIMANPTKKESSELVKEFFSVYDFIETQSKPKDSLSFFAYEFLKMTILGETAFQKHALHSRLFNITSVSKMRDVMNGTLSNFFIHKLCQPTVLHFAATDIGYIELWLSVLQNSRTSSKLIFFEAVMEELESTIPHLCPENTKVLIALWTCSAKSLVDYIEETQNINQGGVHDDDWTCIYNTLLFPILRLEDNISSIIFTTAYEDMKGAWRNLWNHFTSLSTLAVSVEPNIEAEVIAKKMLSLIKEKLAAPPDALGPMYYFFSEVSVIVLDKFKFQELGKKPKKMLQSPLKPKRKGAPLCNLQSLLEIMVLLTDRTLSMVSDWRQKCMSKLCLSFVKIFIKIHQDKFITAVISQVLEVLKTSLKINPAAKFSGDSERAFVDMWNAFCSLIDAQVKRKSGQDKSLLGMISPLLCVALQSSHGELLQRTRALWTSSFASTSLPIPNDLFDILKKGGLPPASISEIPACQTQSLSPKENIPTHISGSFLNREKNHDFSPFSSPKLKFSPQNSVGGKSPTSFLSPQTKKPESKKKANIDDLKAENFVVVSCPKPKKRVLTPHQAEKMKRRPSDIPALYNDMSQSLSQLPSQFITQESFETQKDVNPTEKIAILPSKEREKSRFLDFNSALSAIEKENDESTEDDTPLNKSYSEQELNEVLRDASLEMEKSFSESVVVLNSSCEANPEEVSVRKSKRSKNLLTYTNEGIIVNEDKETPKKDKETPKKDKEVPKKDKETPKKLTNSPKKGNDDAQFSAHNLKRKSSTPKRKSLQDIQKTLRGTPNESKTRQTPNRKLKNQHSPTSLSKKESFSPKKSDFTAFKSRMSPVSSASNLPASVKSQSNQSKSSIEKREQNLVDKNASTSAEDGVETVKRADSFTGSEDEIPNSQLDETKESTSLLNQFCSSLSKLTKETLHSSPNERPKRNKRKSVFEDDTIYFTPPKRQKSFPSPSKNENSNLDDSVIILRDESRDRSSPQKNRISNSESDIAKPKTPIKSTDEMDIDSKVNNSKEKVQSDAEDSVVSRKKDEGEVSNFPSEDNGSKTSSEECEKISPDDASLESKRKEFTTIRESTPQKDSGSLSFGTPPKITRSGRRIVAPNKDMPEPMTPPGATSKKTSMSEAPPSSPSPQKDILKNFKDPILTKSPIKECTIVCEELKNLKDVSLGVELKDKVKNENDEKMKHETNEELSSDKKTLKLEEMKPQKKEEIENDTKVSDSLDDETKTKIKIQTEELGNEFTKLSKLRRERRSTPLPKIAQPAKMNLRKKKSLNLGKADKDDNHTHVEEKETPSSLGEEVSIPNTPSVGIEIPEDSNDNQHLANNSVTRKEVGLNHSTEENLVNSVTLTKTTVSDSISSSTDSTECKLNSNDIPQSMFKVIFSPKSFKTSQAKFSGTQSDKPILTNGGVSFNKGSPQRIFLRKGSESLKSMMQRSNSLDKLPSLINPQVTPPMLSQINFKKVGSLSSKANCGDKGQEHRRSLSEPIKPSGKSRDSVIEAGVSNTYSSSSDHMTKTNELEGKGAGKTRVTESSASPDIVSVSAKDASLLSASPAPTEIKEAIIEKVNSLNNSDKDLSSVDNLHLSLDNSDTVSEKGRTGSGKPKSDSPGASPLKILTSNSQRIIRLSPKSQDLSSPTSGILISTSSQSARNQKILFISSPKNSSSPVQKVLYSPQNLKCSQTKYSPVNEQTNQVFVINKETKLSKDPVTGKMDPEVKQNSVTSEDICFIGSSKPSPQNESDKIEEKTEKSPVKEKTKINSLISEEILEAGKELIENKENNDSLLSAEKDSNAKTTKKNALEDSRVDQVGKKSMQPAKVHHKSSKLLKKTSAGVKKKTKPLKRRRFKKLLRNIQKTQEDIQLKLLKDEKEKDIEMKSTVVEKDSPDKDNSKLSNSVSTPERKKFSMMKVQIPGSRAAIMLACAKRTMRTRLDDNCDLTVTSEDTKQPRAGTRLSEGLNSPGITPSRKRPYSDRYPDGKPWAKHEPSPGASPCGSILKKKPVDEEGLASIIGDASESVDVSPSTLKNRRVSFADPPVSESVEIPPSPKLVKGHKAQKRLDMTQAINNAEILRPTTERSSCDSKDLSEIRIISPDLETYSETIYPSLVTCTSPVEEITSYLATSLLENTIRNGFKLKGLKTVGDFCSMSEADLEVFNIRNLKTPQLIDSIRKFEDEMEHAKNTFSLKLSESPASKSVSDLDTDDQTRLENPSKRRKLSADSFPDQDVLIEFGTDSDTMERTASVAGDGLPKAEEETGPSDATEESSSVDGQTSSQIKEKEFPQLFCDQIQRDATSMPSFVQGLSEDTRAKLFEALTNIIPYKNVIDMFHKYLIQFNT